jgi:hypothetical protein
LNPFHDRGRGKPPSTDFIKFLSARGVLAEDAKRTRITIRLAAIGHLGNGGLAMGRSASHGTQGRRVKSPLGRDGFDYDKYTDVVVSLLQENARLRKLVISLSELVLRSIADAK